MVSFVEADQSEQDGNRVELFEFLAGDVYYRYHNGQRDLTYNGLLWLPTQIKRGRSSVNQNKLRNSTKVSMSNTNEFAAAFIGQAIDADVTVRILQVHLGATGERIVWTGRITKAVAPDEMSVEFDCQSSLTVLAREGLRAKFERACPHQLYSGGCRLTRTNYEVTVNAVQESGAQLSHATFAGQPDGWWSGGVVENAVGERRLVIAHSGAIVTLSRPFITGANGGTVKIVPGCDKTLTTCNSKFNNSSNFGGVWYLPTKNPFEGLG